MQQWKIQEGIRDIEDMMRRSNICIIGVLQGEDSKQERTEAFIFDEIIAVNFPKLM